MHRESQIKQMNKKETTCIELPPLRVYYVYVYESTYINCISNCLLQCTHLNIFINLKKIYINMKYD